MISRMRHMSLTEQQRIRVSKAMSLLLRHRARNENVPITDQGYILIDDLLTWLNGSGSKINFHVCRADIEQIVQENGKQRFKIDGDSVRANQGHSMEGIDVEMEEYRGSGVLFHGTYLHHRESMERTGLSSMSRQHIHMVDPDGAGHWASMIRKDINMIVSINYAQAVAEGHKFLRSSNGVVLTEGPLGPHLLTFIPCGGKPTGCYGIIVTNQHAEVATVWTKAGHGGFPKGKRHRGEHPLACAIRETWEETALLPDMYRFTGASAREVNEKGNSPTTYFYATLRPDVPERPELVCADPDELGKQLWIHPSRLREMPDRTFLERRKVLLPIQL